MNKIDITIVMAIYKPRLDWLQEELVSIYKQTYRNFQLIVWNDCPNDKFDYNAFFKKYLIDIPFCIYHGDKNLGSNGAFENLTKKVDTPFIAYCDQDDIWMPDKLEKLYEILNTSDATLAYSDMQVINENSEVIAQHICEIRPRQKFYSGKDALPHLLAKNFVTGCTMMMRTDIAQKAVPFPSSVFHDWWLAVFAAMTGNIVKSKFTLMKYRIYGGNQSAVLKGITDKKSYFEIRIAKHYEFIQEVVNNFEKDKRVNKVEKWVKARVKYFNNPSMTNLKMMIDLRKINLSTTIFEIILPYLPNVLFEFIISTIKSGKL
ncbi:glycosyltransferase [uncultured Megasphaera sp.]|uniref:glycosyltransferase n=1 Tax=uncultured Megasphaera sp. TaxID=165188 RepID=UPI0025F5E378|nr:glycosyltransferase [uncultured Megasphaera sp.]